MIHFSRAKAKDGHLELEDDDGQFRFSGGKREISLDDMLR